MGASVTHSDEYVIFLKLNDGFQDFLSADVHFRGRIIIVFFVADDNHFRIVVLDDFRRLVVLDLNDGKGRVRNAANRAYRKGCRNGRNTFFQRKSLRHHGGDNLGCQCGQNTGFHAAAQTVGKDNHRGVLIALLYDIHMVAAKLFAVMIDAFIADIRT